MYRYRRVLRLTWRLFVLESGNGLKGGLDPFGSFVLMTFNVDGIPTRRLGIVTNKRPL